MGGFGGVWVAGGLGYEGGLGAVGCLGFLGEDRGEEKEKGSCFQMFSLLLSRLTIYWFLLNFNRKDKSDIVYSLLFQECTQLLFMILNCNLCKKKKNKNIQHLFYNCQKIVRLSV